MNPSSIPSQFVYLMPKESGYETVYAEFQGQVCLLTPLLEYKTHQDFARTMLTMTHFTELIDGKEIVLMRGEYDGNRISPQEAQYLANQVQIYYIGSEEKYQHVVRFNHEPEKFDFGQLVKEMETLS